MTLPPLAPFALGDRLHIALGTPGRPIVGFTVAKPPLGDRLLIRADRADAGRVWAFHRAKPGTPVVFERADDRDDPLGPATRYRAVVTRGYGSRLTLEGVHPAPVGIPEPGTNDLEPAEPTFAVTPS